MSFTPKEKIQLPNRIQDIVTLLESVAQQIDQPSSCKKGKVSEPEDPLPLYQDIVDVLLENPHKKGMTGPTPRLFQNLCRCIFPNSKASKIEIVFDFSDMPRKRLVTRYRLVSCTVSNLPRRMNRLLNFAYFGRKRHRFEPQFITWPWKTSSVCLWIGY